MRQNRLERSQSLVKKVPLWLIGLIVAWFIISFILLPTVTILKETFIQDGSLSLGVVRKLAASDRVKKALVNSFVMAFLTVLTVNIVGIFQVAVTEFFEIKFAKALRLAFFTPLIYSSIALVTGYKFVYGPQGAFTRALSLIIPNLNTNWFNGFAAVLFVHTFSMTSFHIIFVRNAIRQIDNSTIEAARTLGANNFQIFVKIAIPILLPSIYASTLMLFLTALSSHAAPYILGGNNFEMINSLIQTLNRIRRVDMAALLSLVLGVASFGLLIAFRSLEKKGRYSSLSTAPTAFTKLKIRNPIMNGVVHASSYLLFIIYSLPVLLVVAFSFAPSKVILTQVFPTQFTLRNYISVITSPVYSKPLVNSILLSAMSTMISLMIALVSVIAMRKGKGKLALILEFTMFIPWVIPASMLAMGLITAFSSPNLLLGNKILLGSFWILPIGYSVFRLPFAVRNLNAALLGINKDLEDAARSMGASVLFTYRKVIIPLLMPSILSISALTFNALLSEYTLSALLYNINNTPLGIAMGEGSMSNEPEQTARVLVYVVILMALSLTTILITNHLNAKEVKNR